MRHALRHPTPMLDLAAVRFPTFALCTVSAGLLARIAISMTPFLLPLMFQIGFGASAFEAGIMLLVYMTGNLAMKSRDDADPATVRIPECACAPMASLCVASLVACGTLAPAVPLAVVYGVLFAAGMTRSMHFTSVNTLAFADISSAARAGATTLAAMAQQAAGALGVALAALALSVFQAIEGGPLLTLADFQRALFASAGLMAVAVVWMLRLPANAGAELARKA